MQGSPTVHGTRRAVRMAAKQSVEHGQGEQGANGTPGGGDRVAVPSMSVRLAGGAEVEQVVPSPTGLHHALPTRP